MKKIYGTIDIAFSINSVLPRNPNATPIILHEIYKSLKQGGLFIAIFPSFDNVLYLKELWCKCGIVDLEELCKLMIKNFGSKCKTKLETMLEFDKLRKLNVGKQLDADDFLNVHRFIYDKDTQPLLRKAGFRLKHMEKVTYHPYKLCKEYVYDYFPEEENWDFFVVAEKLKKEYLFSWDNVPGDDNEKLLRFLWDDLDIGWAKIAKISKSDDRKTIRIFKDENSAEIVEFDGVGEQATLRISGGGTHDLKVKKENDKLNIYKKEN